MDLVIVSMTSLQRQFLKLHVASWPTSPLWTTAINFGARKLVVSGKATSGTPELVLRAFEICIEKLYTVRQIPSVLGPDLVG